ncbi:UNVERIFIED_CONTAM: hypothetical protein Sradi_3152000 [Sesamum radiatum]|uniref:Uncharacterized protein n=1 Tax=Sesamum radiatum TaxID=300843 RepID=A0AAW2RDR6_SESRA
MKGGRGTPKPTVLCLESSSCKTPSPPKTGAPASPLLLGRTPLLHPSLSPSHHPHHHPRLPHLPPVSRSPPHSPCLPHPSHPPHLSDYKPQPLPLLDFASSQFGKGTDQDPPSLK